MLFNCDVYLFTKIGSLETGKIYNKNAPQKLKHMEVPEPVDNQQYWLNFKLLNGFDTC